MNNSPFACTVAHDYTVWLKFDVEVASTPFLPVINGKHRLFNRFLHIKEHSKCTVAVRAILGWCHWSNFERLIWFVCSALSCETQSGHWYIHTETRQKVPISTYILVKVKYTSVTINRLYWEPKTRTYEMTLYSLSKRNSVIILSCLRGYSQPFKLKWCTGDDEGAAKLEISS